MKVAVAHPGTQHSFRLVSELDRLGFSVTFFTGLVFDEGSLFRKAMRATPGPHRRVIASHTLSRGSNVTVRSRPMPAVAGLVAHKLGFADAIFRRNEKFQEFVCDEIGRDAPEVVIGFDTSSHKIAAFCKSRNIPFVLDQTIAHFSAREQAFDVLAARNPDWAATLAKKSAIERRNEDFELASATRIVAPSTFTKNSLINNGVDPRKIVVIPFGVDSARFSRRTQRNSDSCRFIFVGAVSARKGIHVLLDAWERIRGPGRELWVVGSVSDDVRSRIPDRSAIRLLGRVAHVEVAALMREADVLVFPSLCEGLALVLLEALASGLPVIATPASGAPDLLDGRDCGTIVETHDAPALADAMAAYAENRQKLASESLRSVETARYFTWERYGATWAALLREVTEASARTDVPAV